MFFCKSILIVIIPLFISSCYPIGEDGYITSCACAELNNKIPKEELFKGAGSSYATETTDKGIVFFFDSSPAATGPVKLLVDPKTDVVIGKKCSDTEGWVYFTDAKQ